MSDDQQRDAARYRWLLENDQRWSWNPTRYNKAVVSGFSCSGTGYLGYSLEQAIALASWADRVTVDAALTKEQNTCVVSAPSAEPVIAVVTESSDFSAKVGWTLNPLPVGTELYTTPPDHREAMRMAATALGIAAVFLDWPSRSPALADECRKNRDALRSTLGEKR